MHLLALLSYFAIVLATDEDPSYVLDTAVWNALNGDDVVLQKLLTRADGSWREDLLNIQEASTGQSLVMKAVLMGKTETARLLIEAGADLFIPEKMGYVLIDAAAFQGRAELVRLLATKISPEKLNYLNPDGHRPIHRAVWGREERHTDTVRAFLELGVPASTKTTKDLNCLQMLNDMPAKRQNPRTKELLEIALKEEEEKAQQERKDL